MRSTWTLLGAGWDRLKAEAGLWVRMVGFQILMTVVIVLGLVLVSLAAFAIAVVVLKTGMVLRILGLLFAVALESAAIVATIYFLGGAYLALIVASMGGEQQSVTEYYRAGLAAVRRLVTSQLWLLLALAVLCSLPLALLLAGIGSGARGLSLVAVLLFFAVIIFVSIVSVRFSIVPFIVVGEGLGGRSALRRAWQLTDGRWWKALLVVGATQLVALFLGFVDGIATSRGGIGSDLWTFLYVLITLALTVWTLLVLREFYRDLSGK
jgi:hypothetical protein